jgi:predicted AAA+ superfamily ATPase
MVDLLAGIRTAELWKHMARKQDRSLLELAERIAEALERLAPARAAAANLKEADAFVWNASAERLQAVRKVNVVPLELLQGIDRVRDTLIENTERFAAGFPANNALLWGARGMGKSSLVKAVHARVSKKANGKLKLVEIHREDIEGLPALMGLVRDRPDYLFIVFCDDLSFDAEDTSFKSLKAALEGGIEGRPDNMVFYVTSNRRHLLPRDMLENEQSTAINPHETAQEKVSLSDRFGLWLGFHNCSQEEFLAMVEGYARHFGLEIEPSELQARAIEWSVTRGSRSGRVAWQFIQDLCGRLGVKPF